MYKKHIITGIDTSAAMLKKAERRSYDSVGVLKMNGEKLTFDNEIFDYIVLSHVITVANNPDQLMSEVFRVLKPGGKVFILNHFTPDNWLRYIDCATVILARLLHFKSVFHITDIAAISKFKLIKESSLGLGSYFKLLIYQK